LARFFLILLVPVHGTLDYYGPEYDNLPEIELMDGLLMSSRTPRASIDGVKDVLGRLPEWISAEIESIEITGKDKLAEGSARLIGTPNGLQIKATSPVDALYALNAYLREFCGAMVSWEGVKVPKKGSCKRPEVFEKTFTSPKVRYFGNPSTFSISFAWWDWAHWERFIDWLALNGFNAVLAPVGQEAIWADLWRGLGISQEGLDTFFTGPAFLAWHRTGSLQAMGGPMSQEYLDSQLELNKKIVKRLVSLGIVPVLPTFVGFVPKEFERKYDHLRFLQNGCWNGLNSTFSCTSSLHPSEPEFKRIAKIFVEKQRAIYGDVTDVYSADPFSGSPPKHLLESDVIAMASSIYEGCEAANPNCIWLLNSWTFSHEHWKKGAVRSFLEEVPKGRLLILDLQAEKRPLFKEFSSFYGHNFVWCLQHNFGGNGQMRGNLGRLHESYRSALSSEPGMVGMGLTMEGINQNYVVYQYMIDLAWTEEELDPHRWILGYASARYGNRSMEVQRAWRLLLATYYTQVDSQYDPHGLLDKPELSEEDVLRDLFIYHRPQQFQQIRYWFPISLLDKLANTFTVLNRTLVANELFRLDFADVVREVLQHKLAKRIEHINNGYGMSDSKVIRQGCAEAEALFEKLDSNEVHNLSDWLMMARSAAKSKSEADSFERQALNQVTLFGPQGENLDYARKEWSGLIRKFYSKRWSAYCDYLLSGARYSQKKLDEKVFREVELPFGHL
ncbi:hypothetical protein PMAYCL1PPCAC_31626, partial [Pristionchus mayeri]